MQAASYHGQVGQDALLDTLVFRGMTGGTFVDIGAHDGTLFSNTLMFERDRGWRGLCIEPNPAVFPALQASRQATCLNVAVAGRSGTLPFTRVEGYGEMLSGLSDAMSAEHRGRIERDVAEHGGSVSVVEVPVRTPAEIFGAHGIAEVHLLSVDTEGCEPEILAALAATGAMVHVIDVECNRRHDLPPLVAALGPGFAFVGRHRHDAFFINRQSPFLARRWALRRAILQARIVRTIQKLARRVVHGPKRRRRAAAP